MENCRQKRTVAQQLEALAMVGSLAQQVLKGQPVKSHAHRAEAGVSQPQAKEVVKQALWVADP